MDISSLIERYVGRIVRVSTGGHKSYVGTLASVYGDCIRLEQTLTVSELEEDSWSQRMYAFDPDLDAHCRDAETVIHFHAVGSVTCLEDIPPPAASERGGDAGVCSARRPAIVIADRTADNSDAGETETDECCVSALDNTRLCVELGCDLLGLVDSAHGGDLLNRITEVRSRVASELGLVIPKIRVRDNIQLPRTSYRIELAGCTVASGELKPLQLLAIDDERQKDGSIVDPVFGVPARWINCRARSEYERRGATVVEPTAVVATHLTNVILHHAKSLLSYGAVRDLLDELRTTAPRLVSDLVPNVVPVPVLHRVLGQLLEERVPIRQCGMILESIGRHAGQVDAEELLRLVRVDCSHILCGAYCDGVGVLRVVVLDCEAEHKLEQVYTGGETDTRQTAATIASVKEQWRDTVDSNGTPIVVKDGRLRPWLWRKLNERSVTSIPVLCEDELVASTEVESIGSISLESSHASERDERVLPR
ncbi:MAG: FHIPEP family type III secretion protein [Planctomycetaceae bacterium]|nr:FHIPEP family type III secretion protein [Planctomycetales bacterium]MCB9924260.1 FHIPEP family type III secretion protein [Planctomycetaceae bacterium]